MRIGKVSKEYHISIDNLHYYIKYGLLVPPKPKGQYFFDETTLKDLEWILALKKLDFSLREIHSILSLKRISNFADVGDLEELKELSVVGGDDNGGNVSTYSIKTSLITLTVITISITSTFSVGEACSWL